MIRYACARAIGRGRDASDPTQSGGQPHSAVVSTRRADAEVDCEGRASELKSFLVKPEIASSSSAPLLLHPRLAHVVRDRVHQAIDKLPVGAVGVLGGEDRLAADQSEAADLLARDGAGAPLLSFLLC